MTQRSSISIQLLALLLLPCAASAAGGIDRFQLTGRGTAQAGALAARADDASAVSYNPAAIARLEGLQITAGLDFNNATDEYGSSSGEFRANHTIQFPPSAYVTWKPERSSWALGLGLETPVWYRVEWNPALFPARFKTRVAEVRLFELHPVISYALDDNWSFGGGLRYLSGTLEHGSNALGALPDAGAGPAFFEVESLAEADVDALTFDLAVHYATNAWGWGAVLSGGADLEADGSLGVRIRDLTDPARSDEARASVGLERSRQRFELPLEVRGGVWIAPYPELTVEVDLAYQQWSDVEQTDVVLSGPGILSPLILELPRRWDDTLSIRIGAEGELTETWTLGGGIAFEPSPIESSTLEPGFPRADAMVYAIGFSYELPQLSIDVGYSFHDYDDRSAAGQEALDPDVTGRYSARDQVWSASARWRFPSRP